MGSSPSKNEVVHIRISSSKGRKNSSGNDKKEVSKFEESCKVSDFTAPSSHHKEIEKLGKELDTLKHELRIQKEKCSVAEDLSFSFQTQLDEREREIILLKEEISSSQNSPLTTNKVLEEEMPIEVEENFDRTVHAKDHYINTLEDELKNVRQQTTTQNERYQKKLKKLKAMLSKSRQDSSLKLFELKDENTKLVEENTKLQEQLERLSMDSGEFSRQSSATSTRSIQKSHDTSATNDNYHDDPRMKLILELSEQVATLDAENSKLKQELKHCRKIAEKVERVRIQKKNGGRVSDVVVVEKSASTWNAIENSGFSPLQIGEQA